jgi:hypothetical protein
MSTDHSPVTRVKASANFAAVLALSTSKAGAAEFLMPDAGGLKFYKNMTILLAAHTLMCKQW